MADGVDLMYKVIELEKTVAEQETTINRQRLDLKRLIDANDKLRRQKAKLEMVIAKHNLTDDPDLLNQSQREYAFDG